MNVTRPLISAFSFNKLQRLQGVKAHLSRSSSTMSFKYLESTPEEVKNDKGIHLLTTSTPNGQKVQIYLEELALKYGTEWKTTLINIGANTQKEDWYLALNPNGRIPVIVDNTISPPYASHETSAELLYLASKFDKDHEFDFADDIEKAELLTWLFFWHGSGAPYMGNTGYFKRAAEKSEFAIKRFHDESLRVFGVLELRLSGKYSGEPREYLAGKGKGKYSLADIGTWPWVMKWEMSWTEEERAPFTHLKAWIDRIAARPAVQTGTGDKYNRK